MTENRPVVGVVVPNKNGGRYLRDCLDSILGQDYPSIECIVMDAESTDDSIEILRSYGDRIRWESRTDSCAAEAINRGWSELDAPILAWLNSDDLWAPGAVSMVVETFAAHPSAGVVSGECPVVDGAGDVIGYWPTGPFDLVRSLSHADHILNQPAVWMRREALERVGWLREMWLHDHDLWLRLALVTSFVHIPQVLAFGRGGPENLGADANLVAPLRIKVVEDFLARPDLPPELARLARRSRSWAHLRAAKAYFDGKQGVGKGMRHLGRAIATDPINLDFLRIFGRKAQRLAAAGKQRLWRHA